MELRLTHGRNDPNEDMEDWGFDGPTLLNVKSVQQMYVHRFVVTFTTDAARDEAQRATGWPTWEDKSLEMLRFNDLIEAHEADRAPQYFGDLDVCEHESSTEVITATRHLKRAAQALHEAMRSLDCKPEFADSART